MLKVKTTVRPSNIAGYGLFLAEFIPKGTVVWEFQPEVDRIFEDPEIAELDDAGLKKLMFHAYLNSSTGKVVWCGDGALYMNHSEQPTLLVVDNGKPEGACIAARDLWPGEELTCNYYDFDGVADWKLGKSIDLRLKLRAASNSEK